MILLHDFLQSIKQAACEAVEAEAPTKLLLGEVVNLAPLEVQISQEVRLTRRHLRLLQGALPLEVGMQLALLRFPGGQRYLSLGPLQ